MPSRSYWTMKRKALGKGLRSLIPEAPAKKPSATPETPSAQPPAGSALREIDLDLIRPNRKQPRETIEPEALGELAQSLENQGVLQPVVVRPAAEGRFELVAGERRWRAAQMVGLMRIPALVRDVPDDRLLEYALVENLQREQLNPIEEAQAYKTLAAEFGLTLQEIADRAGKNFSTVSNMTRLLALPKSVQSRLRARELSVGHAKVILSLKQPIQQIQAADRVVKDGLSVRDTERLVRRIAQPPARKPGAAAPERDPNVSAAEEQLQRELGARVRIHPGARGGGRIEIHCHDADDLDRVYELMLAAARRKPSDSQKA
jgi:ParB family chromosome partitioning protein